MPSNMMDMKMVQCDCCFIMQSHNENEIVMMTQIHVKDTHHQDMSAREVKGDRKSTRLNSSHVSISYAVFCLKKKNEKLTHSVYRAQTADDREHPAPHVLSRIAHALQ